MLGAVTIAPAGTDVEALIGPLGPDADSITADDLSTLLDGRRGKLKSALMDQTLLAGLGNELSDEVLWRACLHPERPAAGLDQGEVDALHRAMDEVLAASKRHGRIPEASGWLEPVRGTADPSCPRCGAPIETIRSAGRTAYICRQEQV